MTQPDSLAAIIAEMREPENSGQFGPWQITAANIKDWADRLAALAGAAPVAMVSRAEVAAICEHFEDEADKVDKPNEHAVGFYRGQYTTAKRIRRYLFELPTPHAPAKAREDGPIAYTPAPRFHFEHGDGVLRHVADGGDK